MLFYHQANNPSLIRKDREMWNITIHALVQLGAILVVDVFFHFLYILTIPNDMKVVKDLSDWSLGQFPGQKCIHWTHATRLIIMNYH